MESTRETSVASTTTTTTTTTAQVDSSQEGLIERDKEEAMVLGVALRIFNTTTKDEDDDVPAPRHSPSTTTTTTTKFVPVGDFFSERKAEVAERIAEALKRQLPEGVEVNELEVQPVELRLLLKGLEAYRRLQENATSGVLQENVNEVFKDAGYFDVDSAPLGVSLQCLDNKAAEETDKSPKTDKADKEAVEIEDRRPEEEEVAEKFELEISEKESPNKDAEEAETMTALKVDDDGATTDATLAAVKVDDLETKDVEEDERKEETSQETREEQKKQEDRPQMENADVSVSESQPLQVNKNDDDDDEKITEYADDEDDDEEDDESETKKKEGTKFSRMMKGLRSSKPKKKKVEEGEEERQEGRKEEKRKSRVSGIFESFRSKKRPKSVEVRREEEEEEVGEEREEEVDADSEPSSKAKKPRSVSKILHLDFMSKGKDAGTPSEETTPKATTPEEEYDLAIASGPALDDAALHEKRAVKIRIKRPKVGEFFRRSFAGVSAGGATKNAEGRSVPTVVVVDAASVEEEVKAGLERAVSAVEDRPRSSSAPEEIPAASDPEGSIGVAEVVKDVVDVGDAPSIKCTLEDVPTASDAEMEFKEATLESTPVEEAVEETSKSDDALHPIEEAAVEASVAASVEKKKKKHGMPSFLKKEEAKEERKEEETEEKPKRKKSKLKAKMPSFARNKEERKEELPEEREENAEEKENKSGTKKRSKSLPRMPSFLRRSRVEGDSKTSSYRNLSCVGNRESDEEEEKEKEEMERKEEAREEDARETESVARNEVEERPTDQRSEETKLDKSSEKKRSKSTSSLSHVFRRSVVEPIEATDAENSPSPEDLPVTETTTKTEKPRNKNYKSKMESFSLRFGKRTESKETTPPVSEVSLIEPATEPVEELVVLTPEETGVVEPASPTEGEAALDAAEDETTEGTLTTVESVVDVLERDDLLAEAAEMPLPESPVREDERQLDAEAAAADSPTLERLAEEMSRLTIQESFTATVKRTVEVTMKEEHIIIERTEEVEAIEGVPVGGVPVEAVVVEIEREEEEVVEEMKEDEKEEEIEKEKEKRAKFHLPKLHLPSIGKKEKKEKKERKDEKEEGKKEAEEESVAVVVPKKKKKSKLHVPKMFKSKSGDKDDKSSASPEVTEERTPSVEATPEETRKEEEREVERAEEEREEVTGKEKEATKTNADIVIYEEKVVDEAEERKEEEREETDVDTIILSEEREEGNEKKEEKSDATTDVEDANMPKEEEDTSLKFGFHLPKISLPQFGTKKDSSSEEPDEVKEETEIKEEPEANGESEVPEPDVTPQSEPAVAAERIIESVAVVAVKTEKAEVEAETTEEEREERGEETEETSEAPLSTDKSSKSIEKKFRFKMPTFQMPTVKVKGGKNEDKEESAPEDGEDAVEVLAPEAVVEASVEATTEPVAMSDEETHREAEEESKEKEDDKVEHRSPKEAKLGKHFALPKITLLSIKGKQSKEDETEKSGTPKQTSISDKPTVSESQKSGSQKKGHFEFKLPSITVHKKALKEEDVPDVSSKSRETSEADAAGVDAEESSTDASVDLEEDSVKDEDVEKDDLAQYVVDDRDEQLKKEIAFKLPKFRLPSFGSGDKAKDLVLVTEEELRQAAESSVDVDAADAADAAVDSSAASTEEPCRVGADEEDETTTTTSGTPSKHKKKKSLLPKFMKKKPAKKELDLENTVEPDVTLVNQSAETPTPTADMTLFVSSDMTPTPTADMRVIVSADEILILPETEEEVEKDVARPEVGVTPKGAESADASPAPEEVAMDEAKVVDLVESYAEWVVEKACADLADGKDDDVDDDSIEESSGKTKEKKEKKFRFKIPKPKWKETESPKEDSCTDEEFSNGSEKKARFQFHLPKIQLKLDKPETESKVIVTSSGQDRDETEPESLLVEAREVDAQTKSQDRAASIGRNNGDNESPKLVEHDSEIDEEEVKEEKEEEKKVKEKAGYDVIVETLRVERTEEVESSVVTMTETTVEAAGDVVADIDEAVAAESPASERTKKTTRFKMKFHLPTKKSYEVSESSSKSSISFTAPTFKRKGSEKVKAESVVEDVEVEKVEAKVLAEKNIDEKEQQSQQPQPIDAKEKTEAPVVSHCEESVAEAVNAAEEVNVAEEVNAAEEVSASEEFSAAEQVSASEEVSPAEEVSAASPSSSKFALKFHLPKSKKDKKNQAEKEKKKQASKEKPDEEKQAKENQKPGFSFHIPTLAVRKPSVTDPPSQPPVETISKEVHLVFEDKTDADEDSTVTTEFEVSIEKSIPAKAEEEDLAADEEVRPIVDDLVDEDEQEVVEPAHEDFDEIIPSAVEEPVQAEIVETVQTEKKVTFDVKDSDESGDRLGSPDEASSPEEHPKVKKQFQVKMPSMKLFSRKDKTPPPPTTKTTMNGDVADDETEVDKPYEADSAPEDAGRKSPDTETEAEKSESDSAPKEVVADKKRAFHLKLPYLSSKSKKRSNGDSDDAADDDESGKESDKAGVVSEDEATKSGGDGVSKKKKGMKLPFSFFSSSSSSSCETPLAASSPTDENPPSSGEESASPPPPLNPLLDGINIPDVDKTQDSLDDLDPHMTLTSRLICEIEKKKKSWSACTSPTSDPIGDDDDEEEDETAPPLDSSATTTPVTPTTPSTLVRAISEEDEGIDVQNATPGGKGKDLSLTMYYETQCNYCRKYNCTLNHSIF